MVKLIMTQGLSDKLTAIITFYRSDLDPKLIRTLLLGPINHCERSLDPNQPETVQRPKWIDHRVITDLLRSIHQADVREGRQKCWSFADILKGTDLYLCPKPINQRSPQLEEILSSIQIKQDQEAYAQIIGAQSDQSFFTADEKLDWKHVSRSVTLIINSLWSILGVVIAIFWLGLSNYGWSLEKTIVLATMGGLSLGAVELVLCWNYL